MFRIPEKDWREQKEEYERNKLINEMIDDRITKIPMQTAKKSHPPNQYGKYFVAIPENDWAEQNLIAYRKKILEEMIAERRKFKNDALQVVDNKFSDIAIPEKDWREQIQKQKDDEILEELLKEYKLSKLFFKRP